MKTHILSSHSIITRPLGKKALFGLTAALAILVGNNSHGSVIDLGAAAGFSVLTYNSNNSSSDAFNGAPIGVVAGNWTQSGGDDKQMNNTVILSPGFANNGNPGNGIVETSVYSGSTAYPGSLTTAWSNAQTASANLAALTPTQTFGQITSSQTINGTAGTNVISISGIKLNQSAITLNGPAGSTFVLNITGDATFDGGSSGGLLLSGGVTASNVVYNFLNGSNLTTSGGGNAQAINGIVLDTTGAVNLHPGVVNGEVIAQTFTSSSNAAVNGFPPPPSVPETSTVLPLAAVLGLVLFGPMVRRKCFGAQ